MTSNDNYITIEMFNAGIQEIKSELKEIKTELREIKYENQLNKNDTAHLQTTIYWGFALSTLLIGVVIAVVGFMVTLAPTIREYFTSKQKECDR